MVNADQNETSNELAPTVYWPFIVGPPPPPPPPPLFGGVFEKSKKGGSTISYKNEGVVHIEEVVHRMR